jgi:F-type H+-transporting ATPase subunit delta
MTNKTAALRYARALLDVGVKEQTDLDAIERDVARFAASLADHPVLAKVLFNPVVPAPRKRTIVSEITARMQLLPVVAKLLQLLAERDRLVIVPELLAAYRDRLLDYRHVVRAEVTTATPLVDGRASDIEQRLRQVMGRTVTLQTRTDPAILGGIVARIGSTVYDGSVTGQLERMRDRLVQGTGR